MGERKSLVDMGGYKPGRSLIRRNEIRFKPSPENGVFIGHMIAPETGFFNATEDVVIHHIPPQAHTVCHRHDDALVHVLSGTGYTIIDDTKYEWERGDTIHIKPGAYHQHFNTSGQGANFLVATARPLLQHVKPFVMSNQEGADFVDVGDYVPDHPFGLGKTPLAVAEGEAWRGPAETYWEHRAAAWAKRMNEGRTIMKGKDVRWEKGSVQGGEFNAMLVDASLGFDSRMLTMGLQVLPPGGKNETHIHMEAIVYILSGKGYVFVNDERFDVEAGDCTFVHMKDWHQFCAYPDETEPFVQMRILTMDITDLYLFPFPWLEEKDGARASAISSSYAPKLPWD